MRTVSLAVKRYLERFRPEGLVVAVSGGADSLALAAATIDLAYRKGIPLLTVTVDHQVRPEAAVEAAGVAKMLRSLGAPKAEVRTIGAGEVGARSTGPEGSARQGRYRELRGAAHLFAKEHGLGSVDVLLGHTLDDQAETVLLRLARGSGARSLSGMRIRSEAPQTELGHVKVWQGRPLLGLRRKDTEGFCEALSLEAVHDPTNLLSSTWRTAGGEPLRRSAVRAIALPALAESLGQDPGPALARTAALLQDDDDALEHYAAQLQRTASLTLSAPLENEEAAVWVVTVAAAPAAVRRRLWRQLALAVGAEGGDLRALHLEEIDRLVTDWRGQGPIPLPGRVSVRRSGGSVHFAGPRK